MQTGDFFLVDVPGAVESWIQGVEHSKWDHVQPVVREGWVLEASLPALRLIPAPNEDANTRLVEVGLSPNRALLVKTFLESMVGNPYSLWALAKIGLAAMLPFLRPLIQPWEVHGQVCSSALTHAYFMAGVYPVLKLGSQPPDEVGPGDLARAWGVE